MPGGGRAVKATMRRLVRADPDDRWAATFGRIAAYSFLVALVTGILLLPFFQPSMTPVVYHGSYRKLDGLTMSRAYRSTLNISFDVRGGLLIRQVHHWSADLFVAAVCLRLIRVFFRGRFRRPDWLIWVGLLPLGMLAGWSGTILPGDMLSGGSLSLLSGVTLSLPVVGTHLATLIFGGSFPGHVIIPRAYWVHIVVLPVAVGVLLLLSYRSGRPRAVRVRRVDPLLPFTAAALVALGAAAQINPVWLFGPYQPGSISAGAVPDWYMGFLDGALRVMPAWELSLGGNDLALDVLIPAVIVPGLFFTLVAAYPLLDGWIAGGRPPRGLLPPKPADPANRTGVGVAGITFYGLLWAAAANDEIAYHLQASLYTVTWVFRILVLAGPVLAFALTRTICHAAEARRRDEATRGIETGRIVMTPEGGFTEIREKVASRGTSDRSVKPGRQSPVKQELWRVTAGIPVLQGGEQSSLGAQRSGPEGPRSAPGQRALDPAERHAILPPVQQEPVTGTQNEIRHGDGEVPAPVRDPVRQVGRGDVLAAAGALEQAVTLAGIGMLAVDEKPRVRRGARPDPDRHRDHGVRAAGGAGQREYGAAGQFGRRGGRRRARAPQRRAQAGDRVVTVHYEQRQAGDDTEARHEDEDHHRPGAASKPRAAPRSLGPRAERH
jgi:ubiquinol-cytochrome c reductase cytochrome b subunit